MTIKIKLSQNQQKMLLAAVLCVGSLGYLYAAFFWLPISKKEADLQKQLGDLNSKIATATRQSMMMPHLKVQLDELNKQTNEVSKQIPNSKGVGNILVTLSALAQQYNISVISFSPGKQISKPYFFELQYPLTIEGQFHDIGKFFAALALKKRIFNIQDVSFGPANAETGLMHVNFILLAYQYKT